MYCPLRAGGGQNLCFYSQEKLLSHTRSNYVQTCIGVTGAAGAACFYHEHSIQTEGIAVMGFATIVTNAETMPGIAPRISRQDRKSLSGLRQGSQTTFERGGIKFILSRWRNQYLEQFQVKIRDGEVKHVENRKSPKSGKKVMLHDLLLLRHGQLTSLVWSCSIQ